MLAHAKFQSRADKKRTKVTLPYAKVVPELTGLRLVLIPLYNKQPISQQWHKITQTPPLDAFKGYNIGILTGAISGITVLDIDRKEGGVQMWNSLSSAFPEIVTPTARTGSNGLHMYFRYNKKLHSFSRYSVRGKQIGWDLLNNDRQCVAPPSISLSTNRKYKWVVSPSEAAFAPMPSWLENYLLSANSFHSSKISDETDFSNVLDSPTLDYSNVAAQQPPPQKFMNNDTILDINPTSEQLNKNLMEFDYDWDDVSPQSVISRVPLMEYNDFDHFETFNHQPVTLGIQSRMVNPYYMLELLSCMTFDLIICSNSFTFTLIVDASTELNAPLRFLVFKAINLACLAFVLYVNTNSDTYKSLNVTIEYLAVNAVIYEYPILVVIKYLMIRIVSGFVMAFAPTGIYYNLIDKYTTEQLVANVLFVTSGYTFTYSYYLTAILLHFSVAIGLTVLTDSTTSSNARSRVIAKSAIIYFCRSSFGVVVGPVGYIWTNVALYLSVIVTRHRYDLVDVHWMATYIVMIVGVIVIYPLIAIQIKFIWKNKYRRYIEYKQL
ncbi:hypothetical protein PHYBOEH_005565 [Phytophthora boehmeriae]|uniref:DNA primase/polymerase bifunctional N-terminal domain-containing protein n=1 Tax=Phytophthora boehmeriae TaxID=109152 RepID=A0A8T1WLV6_9STRA|nr:hypothetical protein PHYBOEH_005565 [Phytophthora boehmeriae]